MTAQFVLDEIVEKEQLSVNEAELTEHIVRHARRATAWARTSSPSRSSQAGQVPVLVGEVVRGKALALVLEKAKVTDASGRAGRPRGAARGRARRPSCRRRRRRRHRPRRPRPRLRPYAGREGPVARCGGALARPGDCVRRQRTPARRGRSVSRARVSVGRQRHVERPTTGEHRVSELISPSLETPQGRSPQPRRDGPRRPGLPAAAPRAHHLPRLRGRRRRTPTRSAPSCCCWPPRTPTRTSSSTSTRPAARSTPAWRSTTPCSSSRTTSRPSAMGLAASMGQFLLCAGATGKRYALPHARIMMHQPSGGIGGTASDIKIQAEQIAATSRRQMAELIAEHTGQTVEQIEADSDRDRWFTAERGQGLRLRRPRRRQRRPGRRTTAARRMTCHDPAHPATTREETEPR